MAKQRPLSVSTGPVMMAVSGARVSPKTGLQTIFAKGAWGRDTRRARMSSGQIRFAPASHSRALAVASAGLVETAETDDALVAGLGAAQFAVSPAINPARALRTLSRSDTATAKRCFS